MRFIPLVVIGLAIVLPRAVSDELKPATLAAFQRYVELTSTRVQAEVAGRSPFLWIDRQPAGEAAPLRSRLMAGDVVVDRLETLDGGREVDVDGGMIHHWVGTVLIPGRRIDDVFGFIQAYDRYPAVFEPMIQRAQVQSRDDGRFVVSMRTYVHKVITVIMDVDYDIQYRRLDAARGMSTNVATRIFEVHDAGQPDEQREPGDQASGYLWRFQMWCSFAERPEGTYEQCESVSLTRGIPFGLGWIVGPFVTSIPRETLEFTLGRIRAGMDG